MPVTPPSFPVVVTGRSVGWTEPVTGPDGTQLREPIRGMGNSYAFPRWKHHVAQAGDVVSLPESEYRRLMDLGVVEDVAAQDASDAMHAHDGDHPTEDTPEPAKAAEEPVLAGNWELEHVGAGWYVLPSGERVRGKAAAEAALADSRGA